MSLRSTGSAWAVPLACLWLAACSGSGSKQAATPAQPNDSTSAGNFRGRSYERNFVFTTLNGDSTILVPWLMSMRTLPGAVQHETRGFLARGGTWAEFYSEKWSTPPSRAPWRILPHTSLHLIVGQGDEIDDLLFEEGARSLELELDDVLQDWTGPRGETFRLQKAAAYLAGRRVNGIALDMFRARGADDPEPGDWAFLVSGDSLQAVIESPQMETPGTVNAYRGWARLDFRNLQWPTLTVDWTEVRAFQPARHDVPVAWAISSDGDEVSGALEVRTAQIRAGEGSGPVLPVDALFDVVGTLKINGSTYPVRGLFRHRRP